MEVTARNNGSHNPAGSRNGGRVSVADREKFFKKEEVVIFWGMEGGDA